MEKENLIRNALQNSDSEIDKLVQAEAERQQYGLELIPSENFSSQAVREAMASPMNDKYAEGYPRKRYYGGNQVIDTVEELAIERAKQLFKCEHVNVQPYSGSPANAAAYFAVLNPGDTIMGMALAHGGHLTHGHKVNFSGKLYKTAQYGLSKETGKIDYDEIEKMAKEHQPKIIVSGATAYPREFDFKRFSEIAESVGAYSMADVAHIAGLIAGGVHQSPFPHTDIVTTTTHKTLRGPRGAMIMCREEDKLKEKYHAKSKWNLAQRIDRAVFPGLQGGPHEHQIAAKAVAFGEALKPEFKDYAAQIVKNAKVMSEILIEKGFDLVTGGTDNHLMLIDLTNKNITGQEAETALDKAGITVNKNAVPYDTRSPFDPSGIRLGTPAITTRGLKESECKYVAELIDKTINNHNNEEKLTEIRQEVKELCSKFLLYEL
jgi:glycine hydroxymethyltransferase|tara:strand:+ start:6690 stop:7991 length:1302 start_codon:yes stop_codon:yes gene_type:complete